MHYCATFLMLVIQNIKSVYFIKVLGNVYDVCLLAIIFWRGFKCCFTKSTLNTCVKKTASINILTTSALFSRLLIYLKADCKQVSLGLYFLPRFSKKIWVLSILELQLINISKRLTLPSISCTTKISEELHK